MQTKPSAKPFNNRYLRTQINHHCRKCASRYAKHKDFAAEVAKVTGTATPSYKTVENHAEGKKPPGEDLIQAYAKTLAKFNGTTLEQELKKLRSSPISHVSRWLLAASVALAAVSVAIAAAYVLWPKQPEPTRFVDAVEMAKHVKNELRNPVHRSRSKYREKGTEVGNRIMARGNVQIESIELVGMPDPDPASPQTNGKVELLVNYRGRTTAHREFFVNHSALEKLGLGKLDDAKQDGIKPFETVEWQDVEVTGSVAVSIKYESDKAEIRLRELTHNVIQDTTKPAQQCFREMVIEERLWPELDFSIRGYLNEADVLTVTSR